MFIELIWALAVVGIIDVKQQIEARWVFR